MLGNGRTQKGEFFSIAAAFTQLAADLIGKIIGIGKKKSKTKRIGIKSLWLLKRVILIRKLKRWKAKNEEGRENSNDEKRNAKLGDSN